MWICKAVLPDGTVCDTSNFDTKESCTNCEAPRQAHGGDVPHFSEGIDAHEVGQKLLAGAKTVAHFGSEKAHQYAPVARELAHQAAVKASGIALQSKLAARTGFHPVYIVFFCGVLLIASIVLPWALKLPLGLTVNERTDLQTNVVGADPKQELPGALGESVHSYSGREYVVAFVPSQLADDRKNAMVFAALLTGPIIITDSPVTVTGKGSSADGQTVSTAALNIANSRIFWAVLASLIVLFIIADLLARDIYAMQKLLFSLVGVWVGYCLLVGLVAQSMLPKITPMIPGNFSGDLHISGLMTAPVKIAFVGLIYWMSSMLLRNLRWQSAGKRERAKTA